MSKSVNVSVRLSPNTHESLKARAAHERRPLAALLAILLDDAAQDARDGGYVAADDHKQIEAQSLGDLIEREVTPRFKQAHTAAAKALNQG